MKVKQRLANWLATKEKDYKAGVQIFIDLNIDVDKIGYLSGESDKMRQNILLRMLSNYARVHKIKPQKMVVVKSGSSAAGGKTNTGPKTGTGDIRQTGNPKGKQKVKIDTNPSVRFEDLPADLQVKFATNAELTAQNKTYHAELKQIKDDKDKTARREELAHLMVGNKAIITKNWEAIDLWWSSRAHLSPEEKAVNEALKKDKRIAANLNYIRRYEGTSKEKQQKELESRKKELDLWGVDYKELAEKIMSKKAQKA